MDKKTKVIVITGPTATGKTALAVETAAHFGGEIISIDSRQVYRGLDIGSGKDLEEYSFNGTPIPYHLIDVADPMEEYNLMRFCRDAVEALNLIESNGRLPVFCGGTALYLNALLAGYTLPGGPPDNSMRDQLRGNSPEQLAEMLRQQDPAAYYELKDKNNPTRLLRALEKAAGQRNQVETIADRIEPLVIGTYYPRREVHKRIEQRLDARLASGMIDEVKQLHTDGATWERLEFLGLEYRYVALYLQNKLSYDEMREKLLIKIRQFAKRQDIWFRKMEREGLNIYWVDSNRQPDPFKLIETFLANGELPPPMVKLKDIHYGPVTSKAE